MIGGLWDVASSEDIWLELLKKDVTDLGDSIFQNDFDFFKSLSLLFDRGSEREVFGASFSFLPLNIRCNDFISSLLSNEPPNKKNEAKICN